MNPPLIEEIVKVYNKGWKMKFIDVETVRMFVNGITHTLQLAQHHAKTNNQHGLEFEIQNALVELEVLREELERSDLSSNSNIVEP